MPRKKLAGRTRIAVGLIDEQERFTVARNLASMCRLAEKAGKMGCDLFASEEGGLSLFAGKSGVLDVPGPETRRVARIAKKYHMVIALGLKMRADADRCWNTQVMIGRDGRIMGVYKKILPTNGEIMNGVIPGDEMPVFDFDFGRVACVICYDTQFPEIARAAGVRNVDLVLFSHVGGAVLGDFNGRAIAYENTCWCATIGRGCNALADPRGYTVAQNQKPGELLVVDADVSRITMPISTGIPITPWRVHHLMERRPHVCEMLLGPPVDIECDALPLYIGNPMTPGRNALDIRLVNRSSERQRGVVEARFPFPMRIISDEHVAWYIRTETGLTDWKPSPKRLRFDLKPGETKVRTIRYTVPDDAEGVEAIRLIGRTQGGEEMLWQRKLERFAPPPELRVPRVDSADDVARKGVRIALDRQFSGGPAGSKTTLRLAHDGQALLIAATCRKHGPWIGEEDITTPGEWHDKGRHSPDELSMPIIAEPWTDRVFWCHLARTGQVSTQRREGGTPVKGRKPKWTAATTRDARKWTALIRLPFAEMEEDGGPKRGAGAKERRWRINFQRTAALPPGLNRERCMSEVIAPAHACPEEPDRPKHTATEWATWNPPYGRIDTIGKLGTILFE